MSGEERTTNVVQRNAQPIRIKLIRGAKGAYKWEIEDADDDADSLLRTLNYIDAKLRARYGGAQAKPTEGPAEAVQAGPEAEEPPRVGMEEVFALFPKGLLDVLTFRETEDAVVVKPRGYLGSDKFARIADIIKQHGGAYVSKGRESHFVLPKAEHQGQGEGHAD